MDRLPIPSAEEQLAVLTRGTVDLHPKAELEARVKASHEKQKPLKIKVGFDPTAPDLHLGHTVVIEKMAQFQRFGHEVVFLIGDYTALIGDPTGRNAMRPPLSEAEIKKNAETYAEQVFKILDRGRTKVEWNSSWLKQLSFQDVIKLAAKYNVGRMLERRDFKQRFEEHQQISIHEFLYPLMQAYDSVALECDVEMGGHDQIFNLNAGRQIMEAYDKRPQCVLTVGLLLGLDGVDKMSKSKGNHVGITETPEVMFGKIMSISDETMWSWFPLLLDSSPDRSSTPPLDAKKDLAGKMVARFHGSDAAIDVRGWWDAGRPVRDAKAFKLASAPLKEILVAAALADSNGDAHRKITQGGVLVNEERVADPKRVLEPGRYLIKVGKKSAAEVEVTPT